MIYPTTWLTCSQKEIIFVPLNQQNFFVQETMNGQENYFLIQDSKLSGENDDPPQQAETKMGCWWVLLQELKWALMLRKGGGGSLTATKPSQPPFWPHHPYQPPENFCFLFSPSSSPSFLLLSWLVGGRAFNNRSLKAIKSWGKSRTDH